MIFPELSHNFWFLISVPTFYLLKTEGKVSNPISQLKEDRISPLAEATSFF